MSISTFTRVSQVYRLDMLRAAGDSIDQLASDYHASLKPVRDALLAVADTPLDEPEKWAPVMSALARQLAEHGLKDVPATRRGAVPRGVQSDGSQPEHTFAAQAFFADLAGMITDGSPPTAFFTVLHQYAIAPSAAENVICAALSDLLSAHKERVGPRFAAHYKRILDAVEGDRTSLWLRLHRENRRLSSDTLAAMNDWDTCTPKVPPRDTADIRPSQPAWAKPIDDRLSKLNVAPPRHLDPELAEAYSAVAVGVRECCRLMDSLAYLWSDVAVYRRLAAGVAQAAAVAGAAYERVNAYLQRAGSPNPTLEALCAVVSVHGQAALDPINPFGRRDELTAIITRLHKNQPGLLARVNAKDLLVRVRDQLARVPPATSSTLADRPPAVPDTTAGSKQPPEGLPAVVLGVTGGGEVKTDEIARVVKEILTGELVRFGSSAPPPADPPPPPARVRCDAADRSVYLDGKRVGTGLNADLFRFVSAVAEAHPDPISFKKIMGGNTKGKNPTRIKDAANQRVRGSLPAAHLDFIVGQDGVGYRLNLPPESCHE